ncbi:MAG: hypothetical protein K6A62_01290 [Bacteroidales bacterium]|nr:hypothetical protein [Bacteroidales bacterium]
MQNNQRVFPDTILEQSSLSLFPKTPGTGLLYYLVMIVIIVAFAALFFIEVDVHVNAPGVIKPKEDHTLITSTASGYIHPVKMAPNTYVSKGDTLFFIQSESYSVKRAHA